MTSLRRSLILAATLFCALESGFAQDPVPRPRFEDNPYDFRVRIRNHSGEWTLANDVRVKLKMVGQSTVIQDGQGEHLLKIDAPECLTEFCVAPEGGCLVFAVWKTDDGRSLNYSALVVIQALESGPKLSRIWESGDQAVMKERWWVSDLGAVSECGDHILANFGEIPEGENGVRYRWQTWKVSPPTRLGIGLKIANGQTGNSPGAG